MEMISIGGVPQSLWFRGVDVGNPALILLHGGPGTSESALFRSYDSALEHHFLVVYWEQRGTGRSYHGDLAADTMTIDRIVKDLDEVVELVRSRFHARRVILLGHSWGTVPGTIYAATHPEKVAAYVGVGQIADMPAGERLSYEFAQSQARQRKDQKAIRELEEIGAPPHSVNAMLVSRKWVERLGGTFHGNLSTGALIWSALMTDEANLIDLVDFGRGNRFSLEHLWQELAALRLSERYESFSVPIVFILGRYDHVVPSVLAERYFHQLRSPRKHLVWFEQSAHNPPFEEPDLFVQTLVDLLR
ncbi:alpha/beta hydrolase [Nitrospira sp. KM1]|nr:alpha/beta hydrolase [Nitrospira sp. KM1]